MSKEKRILYISSANPLKGPGSIAMDHYKALKEANLDVDFLTTYPVEGHPEFKYVLSKPINKYWDRIRRFPFYFLKKFRKPLNDEGPFYYFYRKETEPPVPIKKVLKKIDKKYDIIIVFFWQNLLSYATLDRIYDKSGNYPPVYFINADFSTMTGGCHFFCSCRRYQTGCGKCPMINSKNPKDFTAWNSVYRQKIIKKIKPYITVNSFSLPHFEKSIVMNKGAQCVKSTMIIDLDKFRPSGFIQARDKYNIDTNKFVILFGSQNLKEERKGMKYLFESLNMFFDSLSPQEREGVLLLSIGSTDNLQELLPPFDQKHLGYVNVSDLPEIYSLSNIFVSPSINDPGPSMVNQSIACGTPVVAFEMGTALDVIKDKGSGICVPLKDTAKMSSAIETFYKMDNEQYNRIKKRAREVAEELQSYKSFAKTVTDILKENQN